jgi:hypothetical protein
MTEESPYTGIIVDIDKSQRSYYRADFYAKERRFLIHKILDETEVVYVLIY